MRAIGLLLCAGLVACASADGEDAQPVEVEISSDAAEVADASEQEFDEPLTGFDGYLLADDGLVLVNSASGETFTLTFGSMASDVAPAIGDVTGVEAIFDTNDECPAGAMEFTNHGPLTLNYQDGYFVGWSTFAAQDDAAVPATQDGITLGSTRAQVEQVRALEELEDSSLGYEFFAGEMQLILSGTGPEARVENMWAGTNCIFR